MPSNWTRQKIIFELREVGTTAAALAKGAGLTRFTLYSALERPYPKVHSLIAAALGRARGDIWPQFYDAEGNRRRITSVKRGA